MLMTQSGYARDLCAPTTIYAKTCSIDEAVFRVGQKCNRRCDVFGFTVMTDARDFFHNLGERTIRRVEFGINRPGLYIVHRNAGRTKFPGKGARESLHGE